MIHSMFQLDPNDVYEAQYFNGEEWLDLVKQKFLTTRSHDRDVLGLVVPLTEDGHSQNVTYVVRDQSHKSGWLFLECDDDIRVKVKVGTDVADRVEKTFEKYKGDFPPELKVEVLALISQAYD